MVVLRWSCADAIRMRERLEEESRRGWGVRDGGAGILTVVAQAGVGALLSDSAVRFALLDATSNESAYDKGYGVTGGET